ncbi:MAG: FMN-binding protein [Oscillospiraceae bacterium]|nr:FMN-binding protein [Oscillospiraceae bacterium]
MKNKNPNKNPNKNLKEIIVPVIVLFCVCLVASVFLACTNYVTKPLIDAKSLEEANAARAAVLPAATSFSETDGGYIGLDGEGNIVGYVFTVTVKSYGGDAAVMTGISTDGFVTGLEILSISDTAGLGMNARREEFRAQYIGKTGGISVSKDAPGGNAIDALTGATITSRAVTDAANRALELFGQVKK